MVHARPVPWCPPPSEHESRSNGGVVSAMSAGGEIALALAVRDDRVIDVGLHSSRRTDAARVLHGMMLGRALGVIPSLFTVCAAAHTCAALAAGEAALGVEPSAATAGARRLLCLLEALESYAFQVSVQWAEALGRPPVLEPLRRVRDATGALRRWAVGEGSAWARIGGSSVLVEGSAAPLLADLRAAADVIAPAEALEEERALAAWASRAYEPVGGLLGALLACGAAGFGQAAAPLLSTMPAAWFAKRLQDPEICARPTIDGTPAEAGAIARVSHHPAVARHLARHGRGLLARFVARVADARAIVDDIAALAPALHAEPAADVARARVSGQATSVVDTARGPLAHAIELDRGLVVTWRTVAPTEWSFHPAGVIREALLGAPAGDLARRARWLVTALDPCVPCSVHVQEHSHA